MAVMQYKISIHRPLTSDLNTGKRTSQGLTKLDQGLPIVVPLVSNQQTQETI